MCIRDSNSYVACQLLYAQAAAVPRDAHRSVSLGTRCEVWESGAREAVRRGGARGQVLSECAASPATARRGLVREAVHAGPVFLVHGDEEAGGIEEEAVVAVERDVARPQPARDGLGLRGVG